MNAALLRTAVSEYGTDLGFFRTYLSAAAIPLLTFQNRLLGVISLLPIAQETAIALALVAAAESAAAPAQPFATWSDGDGWRTTSPPFNPFPLPYVSVVAPSSLTLPDGPPGRPYSSFVQSTPSAKWTIQHNLAGNPSVTAFDENSAPIQGEVTYWPGLVVVVFPAPIAGCAYLV